MKKFSLVLLFSLILVFSALGYTSAEEDTLHVYIEGEKQSFDASPFIYQSRTLIPARYVSETLGATVFWDSDLNAVSIIKDDISIYFIIDSSTALVNNKTVDLDTKPLLVKSHSYVPLRFISEAFGAEVQWDGATNSVLIATDKAETTYFDSDFLDHAVQGKLKGCNYSLKNGITASIILADKGKPEDEGSMGGSYYLTYAHCQYHVSFAEYHNENYAEANLLAIKHLAHNLNETPEDVKAELGVPFSEGTIELNDSWYLTYLAEDYKVFLTAENETSPITQIHLKENKSTTLKLDLEHVVTSQDEDKIVFNIRNTLGKEQVIDFYSGQEYDYRLLKDGEIVEQYSASRSFIQAKHSLTLEPNELLTYSAEFSSLEPGEYVFDFWLTSESHTDAQINMTFESH